MYIYIYTYIEGHTAYRVPTNPETSCENKPTVIALGFLPMVSVARALRSTASL